MSHVEQVKPTKNWLHPQAQAMLQTYAQITAHDKATAAAKSAQYTRNYVYSSDQLEHCQERVKQLIQNIIEKTLVQDTGEEAMGFLRSIIELTHAEICHSADISKRAKLAELGFGDEDYSRRNGVPEVLMAVKATLDDVTKGFQSAIDTPIQMRGIRGA